MKVDVTTIFFNSYIPGATATPPWCVSIGQGKEKKINSSIPGLQEILDGLIYCSVNSSNSVDLSAGSKNNEYLLLAKFDKVFINGSFLPDSNMIAALVREHTKSHEGRLRISFPPYAKYNDGEIQFTNEQTYQKIANKLNCGSLTDGGCWFVDDISVVNQDELHFSCIVVNNQKAIAYTSSQERSSNWQDLAGDAEPRIGLLNANSQNLPLQQIFYGAPGTGKSFKIDQMADEARTIRTTFHPDSDYASFVGAYKPTMEDVPINSIYGESVQFATGKNGHHGTEKKIVYKYVPQAFLKAYVAAWSDLSHPYYLVIEEINRGNCAQIFGDLFQLLDRNNSGSSSYAIHADDDIRQFLASDSKGFAGLSDEQKEAIASFVLKKDSGKTIALGNDILNGKLLLLPPNLHIWATMNTSDQSLFPIDSAFKRRWNWEYIPIEYDKENWTFVIGDNRYSWGEFLSKINPEIYSMTESSDKQMGYYFAKADPETGIISEDVFLNKVLFYLWTDVFKDYDVSSELFKNKKLNRPFRFTDFFDKEQPEALEDFIANFNLTPVEIEPENAEDEEVQEKKGKYYKPFKTLTVTFPDGSVIKEDTIVGSYLKALETIGIDRAAVVAATKKYQRRGHALITKEPVQELIDNGYTYATIGDYSVVKGIKNVSYVGLLKQISDALNLNLTATLE